MGQNETSIDTGLKSRCGKFHQRGDDKVGQRLLFLSFRRITPKRVRIWSGSVWSRFGSLGLVVGKPSSCPKRQPMRESIQSEWQVVSLPNCREAGCNCLILEAGRHLRSKKEIPVKAAVR